MAKKDPQTPGINHLIAGSLSGSLSTLALHPLDLLKTRAQVGFLNKDGRHESFTKNIQYIFRSRGVRGFYQALTPNLLGNLVSWGSYMHLFYTFGHIYKKQNELEKVPTPVNFGLAFCAGLAPLCLTNPIWVIKVRMSTNIHPGPYSSLFGSALQVYRTDGVRGYFKGIGFGLVSCIHGGVFLTIYEEIKYMFRCFLEKDTLSNSHYFFASAGAKCLANFVTYPVQVLRSRSQNYDARLRYTHSLDIFKKTWKNERIFGFYKGLLPSTLRVIPSSCLNLLLYETLLYKLKNRNY